MIEEQGSVVALEGEIAWVQTTRKSSCGSCEAKGCGTGAIAKVLPTRAHRVEVRNTLGAEVGDEVSIGMSEDVLIKGSLLIYIVPLLAMMGLALFGEWLAPQWGLTGNRFISPLFGLAGLAAGLWWVGRFSRKAASEGRYQATMIRRIPRTNFLNIPLNHE